MPTKTMLAGTALFGLAMLALAAPADEPGGGVLLNPDPPRAPSWGLDWEGWERPGPAAAARPAAGAVSAAPADTEVWHPDAPAGIWATPAEFAASD